MKKGFTLAEILITLSIIGVIASMTIPSLVQDIQDAQFKVAAKKAYADLSGVIKQMRQNQGSLKSFVGNSGSFKPEFIKYFNVIQDCGGDSCVPHSYTSDIYKSLTGNPADVSIGAEGQFVTNNGMFINIQNSSIASYGIIIIADVNGYKKGPNTYGKDTFAFDILNDVLVPMGAPGTNYLVSDYCNKSSASGFQGFGCAVNMIKDVNY